MLKLLITLLPLALVAALSPTMLAATIVVLATKNQARWRGLAFLTGSAITLTIIGLVAIMSGGSLTISDKLPNLSSVVDLILGVLLLLLGLRNALGKPKKVRPKQHSSGDQKSFKFQLADSLALGVGITATDFSSLIFYLAAAKQTIDAGVDSTQKFLAMSMMAVFIMIPILVPFILTLSAPTTSAAVLDKINAFIKKYSHFLTAIVCVGFGIYLLVKGILEAV